MTARIISGAAISREMLQSFRDQSQSMAMSGTVPHLAVILVGDDPASHLYVRAKERAAADCQIRSTKYVLSDDTSEDLVVDLIRNLNDDESVHGILVQLPLPPQIDAARVIEALDPAKDVDGFHPYNVRMLTTGMTDHHFVPCTPAGCMILIKTVFGDELAGKDAVVIGRSNIVGKPMATLLGAAEVTVTSAQIKTRNIEQICRKADIVVVAAGRPGLVKGSWLKPGAVLIDVGINRVSETIDGHRLERLVGDADFDECRLVAAAITPVPGGVGPMTIAMLMSNALTAAQRWALRRSPAEGRRQ